LRAGAAATRLPPDHVGGAGITRRTADRSGSPRGDQQADQAARKAEPVKWAAHSAAAALAAFALLGACGAKEAQASEKTAAALDGRYGVKGSAGGMVMEFRPDGAVVAHDGSGHSAPAGTYTRDGTTIELFDPKGAILGHLLVDAKGCLRSKEEPTNVLCPLPAPTASRQGPSGTYSAKDGTTKFTFKPGGKVELELAGGILGQGTWRVEDGKLKFFDLQGRGAVMDFDGDRCLVNQVFGRLCKSWPGRRRQSVH